VHPSSCIRTGPDERYKYGSVRFYNNEGGGQPVDINGKPGGKAETHFPIDKDGNYKIPTNFPFPDLPTGPYV
jgi:hypothetical protein